MITKLKHIVEKLNTTEWVKALLKISNVYVVGGSVRDAFLNKAIKDIDLVVEGQTLQHIKDLLIYFGNVDIVGESFSVIKFKPWGYKGEPYDIAIPRMDRKIGEGHKGFEIVTEGVDIITDLKRRDFTVNSISVDLKSMKILDPFKGLEDIQNNILRATDNDAFIEDPLRIIRGIQFAARFGFEIENHTMQMMKDNAHLIREIKGERIFEEFEKVVNKHGNTALALKLIFDTDVDIALFGKKMRVSLDILDNLDGVSFFYTLGILGGTHPSQFIKKRLKSDSNLEKNVRSLDHILAHLPKMKNEEELYCMLFKEFEKAPEVKASILLPKEVLDVISLMESQVIPSRMQDIKINGDDIINMSNHRGEKVGKLIDHILRDALMNHFEWKNRDESLLYLSTLL